MNVIDALMTRRSIRSFTSQPVGDDQLRIILEAAMAAPSAGNERPWHFLVVRDRGVLSEKIPAIHRYAHMCKEAPLAILVAGEPDLEKYKGYWAQDCAAATQNILLAAHGLGLGAVWCGVHPDQERIPAFRALFGMPAGITPFALIPVGHPAETKPRAERFDASRIRQDAW